MSMVDTEMMRQYAAWVAVLGQPSLSNYNQAPGLQRAAALLRDAAAELERWRRFEQGEPEGRATVFTNPASPLWGPIAVDVDYDLLTA